MKQPIVPGVFSRRSFVALGAVLLSGGLSGCGGGASRAALKREATVIVTNVQLPAAGANRQDLLRVCAEVSKMGLPYRFGGETPAEGGLDCSGTIHYLLVRLGYRRPPRQSNHQFLWCRDAGTFHEWRGGRPPRGLRPGDLVFWENTYDTGKRYPANISHVMVYMGRDGSGQFWQFGGRGRKGKGRNGAGIDFHKFDPTTGPYGRGHVVGWARIPGLRG